MSKIGAIFTRLQNLIKKEGQTEFISALIANLLENKYAEQENQKYLDSYKLLKTFLGKIFEAVDELSTVILCDDSILISVKNQKLLRTSFQLISCIGINTCLIPGLGISIHQRSLTSNMLPQLKFKDEEKYELLVACTNFFTRSYKIPVLKSIIITLHLSDYLSALIQLAFAPLKKPGTYINFTMTKEMYIRLSGDRQHFISIYEQLVSNCFQPTLMKELLVLQSANPSPPAFAKRVIAKELSRRLLAPCGILSLIKCFLESYEIDSGLEWKKIDMICRLVVAKHGSVTEEEYLANVSEQLMKILGLNNTHYLAAAIACVISLNVKYPHSDSIKVIIKSIFQVFDYDRVVSDSNMPGTVVLSPQEIDHKVNILHACINTTKLEWDISLLKPNLQILFLIGVTCNKNDDLKTKLKEILAKCLEKLSKIEVRSSMNKLLLWNDNHNELIQIEEYNSGIAVKAKSSDNKKDIITSSADGKLTFYLDILKSSTENDLVKSVFETSLDILVELSLKRKSKGNKDLLALEEEPILLDKIDEQYATILQLLSEISTYPKIITILKTNSSIVVNFIEYFISKNNDDEDCTTIALILLNTVLSNTENDDLEKRFASLSLVLQKISEDETSFNHILCKEALSLITSEIPKQSESPCGKALSDVFDKLLPVRAHGIIELTKLINAKDPETISKKHYIFCIFQEQLKDTDSYIYLSAINGLASLCTHCTEDVLYVLCNEFLQTTTDQSSVKTNEMQSKAAEMRMKTGDVIVKVVRSLGEMAVVHKTVLLNTMLCGSRDEDPLVRASALSNLAEIARVLHYKIGTIIYELLLCIWSIIESDKAVECRRAAVMVISSLLKGLGKETLLQLKDNLLPIYRTLKSLYNNGNEDSVVRLHAQIALEELNDIVNQFLYPELNIEKRIYVLDNPDDVFK